MSEHNAIVPSMPPDGSWEDLVQYTVSVKVEELRKSLGMTRRSFSELLYMHPATYTGRMSGRARWTAIDICRMVNRFNVRFDQILPRLPKEVGYRSQGWLYDVG